MSSPRVSVIIPAHQEEGEIGDTLEALTQQTSRDFEVIVVANGCTDNTVPEALDYVDALDMKVVIPPGRGIGYASNVGAENARGDIYIFLDADSSLAENGVEAIIEAVDDGAVGGTVLLKPEEKSFIYSLLAPIHYCTRGMSWGGIRFVEKGVHDEVGGHREHADFGLDGHFKRKVEALGKITYLSDTSCTTTMRRYEEGGLGMLLEHTMYWFLGKVRDVEKDYPVIR